MDDLRRARRRPVPARVGTRDPPDRRQRGRRAGDRRSRPGRDPRAGPRRPRARHRAGLVCRASRSRWQSPTGIVQPAYFREEVWLRSFHGGLLVTCGLQNVGDPNVDEGVAHGLHGRVSQHPGARRDVPGRGATRSPSWSRARSGRPTSTAPTCCCVGRSASRPAAELIEIEDEVVNQGYAPAALMLLYHVNAGYPIVADGARLIAPPRDRRGPRRRVGGRGSRSTTEFGPPTDGFPPTVYEHRLAEPEAPWATIGIVNPAHAPTDGIALSVDVPAPPAAPPVAMAHARARDVPDRARTGELRDARASARARRRAPSTSLRRPPRAASTSGWRPTSEQAFAGVVAATRRRERRDVTTSPSITAVDVMTIQAQLPAPVVFGEWIMHTREFALVRVRTDAGVDGLLLHADARRGRGRTDPQDDRAGSTSAARSPSASGRFTIAWRRSLASHAAGIGLRALSIVDLACWDAAAKLADRSIAELLGGHNAPMPATAIIGYPPGTMGPEETGAQTARALRSGLAPIQGADRRDSGAHRRPAARGASGRARRLARAWTRPGSTTTSTRPRHFIESIPDVGLGWFEDVFPPGDAGILRRLCATGSDVPIAQGDEQGGSYYPEALIAAERRRRHPRRLHLHGRHHRRSADHRPGARRPASPSRRTCSRTSTAR